MKALQWTCCELMTDVKDDDLDGGGDDDGGGGDDYDYVMMHCVTYERTRASSYYCGLGEPELGLLKNCLKLWMNWSRLMTQHFSLTLSC